jgi:hypothetical protein
MNRKLYLSLFLIICLYNFCFGQIDGYLDIVVVGSIRLLVQDSQGRKAGYDPRIDKHYNEIPNTEHGRRGVDSETPNEPPIEAYDFAFSKSINFPFEDTYLLKLIGLKNGTYQLSAAFSQTLKTGKYFEFEGEIDSLEVKEYEFFYTTDTTKTLYFRECQTSVTN